MKLFYSLRPSASPLIVMSWVCFSLKLLLHYQLVHEFCVYMKPQQDWEELKVMLAYSEV